MCEGSFVEVFTFNFYVNNHTSPSPTWWIVTPLANKVYFYLNLCYETYARITKVNICVAQFVHLHLCFWVMFASCQYVG
jgi:hypothetical protein